MTRQLENYIDGRFVSGDGLEHLDVRNPANNELLARVPLSDQAVVDEALLAAKRAQPAWEALPAIQRAGYLRKISTLIRANAAALADTITREQGKVLGLAQVEVAFTADYIDYMAEPVALYIGLGALAFLYIMNITATIAHSAFLCY